MSVVDALDILYIAHDARLAGRAAESHAIACSPELPAWARPDRLLGVGKTWATGSAEQIRADFVAFVRDAYGPTVDLGPNTFMGGMVEMIVQRNAELWAQIEQVASMNMPDTSLGIPWGV